MFVEADEAFEHGRSAGEIRKAHRPIAEYALIEAGPTVQHLDVAVARVGQDAGENLVDGAFFALKRLQKGAAVKNQHAADAERLVAVTCAEQKLVQIGT